MSSVLDSISGREATADGEQPAEPDATTTAVLEAALRQFELFGLERSTVEEIARRAGVSRVTVYRRFPAKDRLVEAVILGELRRFIAELDALIDPLAEPEERIVEGFVFTLEAARSHVLLQRLLESEPERLLPHLTIDGAPFIAAAREFLTARLGRELGERRSPRELATVAEIVVRLILSFLLTPETPVDLDDRDEARHFARSYVGPILRGGLPAPGAG